MIRRRWRTEDNASGMWYALDWAGKVGPPRTLNDLRLPRSQTVRPMRARQHNGRNVMSRNVPKRSAPRWPGFAGPTNPRPLETHPSVIAYRAGQKLGPKVDALIARIRDLFRQSPGK